MDKLDKCWKNCMSMRRWIAEKRVEGSVSVLDLKDEWLRKHNFTDIWNSCFFCDYVVKESTEHSCIGCPGKKVDPKFTCDHVEYSWSSYPIKFYNKLRSLNRKRLLLLKGTQHDTT